MTPETKVHRVFCCFSASVIHLHCPLYLPMALLVCIGYRIALVGNCESIHMLQRTGVSSGSQAVMARRRRCCTVWKKCPLNSKTCHLFSSHLCCLMLWFINPFLIFLVTYFEYVSAEVWRFSSHPVVNSCLLVVSVFVTWQDSSSW